MKRIIITKEFLESMDIIAGDIANNLGCDINDIIVIDTVSLLDDYQEEAIKTMLFNDKSEVDKYCCMKLSEETGELSGMIAKHYYHKKLFDNENLVEELGDLMWYIAVLAKNNDVKLSDICNYNVEKLRKRHGETYNAEYYADQELVY